MPCVWPNVSVVELDGISYYAIMSGTVTSQCQCNVRVEYPIMPCVCDMIWPNVSVMSFAVIFWFCS